MNKYKITCFIVFMTFIASDCDDFLNEVPDNSQEVKTLENIAELLVSAYADSAPLFLEFKTDNATAIPKNTQKSYLTRNYQYKPVVSENQMTPNYFWSKTYLAIAHSNQALAQLETVKNTNDKLKNAIKGEALITRAYNHFMLANVFCQHYDKTSAGSELGIPYILSPEKALTVSYQRGTLQETYDKIEKDLLAALPLLSDDFYTGSGKYHFNTRSGYAFASRFYLFKGEWEKCIAYANKLLGDDIPSPANFRDMKAIYTGTRNNLMAMDFYDVDRFSNLMVTRHYVSLGLEKNYGYYYTKPKLDEIFKGNIQEVKDQRDSRWGLSSTGSFAPPKVTPLFESLTANTGYRYYIATTFRTEEVVLNRMEAYVRVGQLDKALADYNAYAPSRFAGKGILTKAQIIAFFKKENEQESFLKLVLTERRKEFIRESLRWFDIKRFGLSITHVDVLGEEFILKEKDLRKAIQIPPGAIAHGIQPNPR